MTTPGPLADIRVIDATTVVNGPWAAQTLGDYGADVIKVESPQGDLARQIGPARNPGMAALYLACNRNKRSLVLDLKQPDGRNALQRLVRQADVLLHNSRPKQATSLGLAHAQVAAANPRLISVATYGFRAAGPLGDKPAYDDVIQAGAGLAAVQELAGGEPHFIPTLAGDKISSLAVVSAVLAALFGRERTGLGQRVEVPMYETVASFVMLEHLSGETFVPPLGGLGYRRLLGPARRPVQTRDGYLAVLPVTDAKWRAFFAVVGRPDLADDPRFTTYAARALHTDELYSLMAELLAPRSAAEWCREFDRADVPAMPVNSLEALLEDPQLNATDFWLNVEHPTEGTLRLTDIPTRFETTPASIRRLPPRLGEHTREILSELDYSPTEIAALLSGGAAATAT